MTGRSRNKGKCGEREAAALLRDVTGLDVQRRVRQHDGDSDLMGLEPWVVEVKRDERLSVDAMWAQAVEQARAVGGRPLLLYRRSRKPWRAVWGAFGGDGYYPVEASAMTWWLVSGRDVCKGDRW